MSYIGFVNNDTSSSLTVLPLVSTTAKKSSPTGSYPITANGAASPNYTFIYVAGTLTITAPVTHSMALNNAVTENLSIASAMPKVKSAVSPNGDGINDILIVDNIEKFPVNKLILIDKSGGKIFEMSGYDNLNRVFNGHSNITGKLQLAGTYFYLLQYRDNGILKRKTGFTVIKYWI